MNNIQFTPDWDLTPTLAFPPLRVVGSADAGIPVVIAEDDPVSQKVVTAAIANGGFRTIVTSDGHEAMSALRAQTSPCVAVLDWTMPGMDGAEICRRMRDSGKSIYIIMVSARDSKEDTVRAIDNGADDYLVKPFHREELLARIRKGVRQLESQVASEQRFNRLEATMAESKTLKFQMPL